MPYSPEGAAGAGIMAGVAVALAFYVAFWLFPQTFRLNAFRFLGLMAPGRLPTQAIYLIGITMYVSLCIGFALGYAGLTHAFDVETDIFAWGVLFGLGHWVIDGVALGIVARRHGAVRSGLLLDPGAFALNLPFATAVGCLAAHLLFGMFAGAFYAALR